MPRLREDHLKAYPPRPKFSVDQIPDLSGQVIIVTGGNVGIGQETIRVLLQHNAKVYMASRSKEKAEEAIEELKKQTGKEAIFLELDLLSFPSIRAAAEEFMSKENELHVLFNNAGLMWPPVEQVSPDGYDLQFMTNVIGPFFFTKLLKPVLQAGKETHPDHHCRIIMVSSSGAYMGTLNFDTFKDGPTRRKMPTTNLYFQTKSANMVIARQYAKRYADQGFISVALNPGNIDTPLHRYTPAGNGLSRFVLQPVEKGALTQLWAGTMPEAVNHNGGFLIPWARVGRCRPEAYDDASGEQLYDWLEEQVKDK
ncbi:NAD(P)-binding protein [Rhodofomes roseus]|uniref:NAD(P)-binding protein n=1 Tax=Rhodofomes roseus TaxID=34475 RepID=A0ABQ8K7Q4_9APHY|nr:NAD(P)-binding protein [Rhodofomes roseus]KAH9833169.1 NAD(P)-binding protein [Rhodofomes roseus]